MRTEGPRTIEEHRGLVVMLMHEFKQASKLNFQGLDAEHQWVWRNKAMRLTEATAEYIVAVDNHYKNVRDDENG